MRKTVKNILALCVGLGIALVLAEIVLHIYNPFKSRVRGNEIVLPANVKYEFKDVKIPGLDAHIIHQKNSMGFRGPELPKDPKTVRIFCVGGSTTECFYLGDGKDWPALLMKKLNSAGINAWVNNAGLDGHSTFGHIILLRDHLLKFKPDYVVFLIGCNDVAADGLNLYENYHLNNKKRFLENFELFNLYLSWKRSRDAAKMGMGHKPVDFKTWPVADTTGWEKNFNLYLHNSVQKKKAIAYLNRLDTLAKLCLKAGALPVFITQPSMLCDNVDVVTGRYLGNLLFEDKCALEYAAKLNWYNKGTKVMNGVDTQPHSEQSHFTVVDAANELKASSENYYDFFHYTNKGAEKMANIIFENWGKKIQSKK